MKRHFYRLAFATALLAVAGPAIARNAVVNGSFEMTTLTDKGTFEGNVTGWTGGAGLDYLDFPGTADGRIYLAVYGPFPNHSPDGGNFVEADGDQRYGTSIQQTLTGLTVGKVYNVGFYQAAGQQKGFTGPTTERWDVSFGNTTLKSAKFSLPQAGVGQWQKQSLAFTATATSQVLKFLAEGTPNGKPPISFLDGVTVTVPEPATWAMMLAGFGLVGFAMRRRSAVAAA